MKTLFRAETIEQQWEQETDTLKKISDIWYAIGFESFKDSTGKYHIMGQDLIPIYCKSETRAVHFEDMIDSENHKMFASLSSNGLGGDVCTYKDYGGEYTLIFKTDGVRAEHMANIDDMGYKINPRLKIVGVQQEEFEKKTG